MNGRKLESSTGNLNPLKSLSALIQDVISARTDCSERGYHRVSHEPEDKKETMICYDCETRFTGQFAEESKIKYVIEPL